MVPPLVNELPPPPPSRTGWPWTEGTAAASSPSPQALPAITIVTPSFNQASFLEETIRSVLLQGYPNLEYIVIDGGSKDGSVEIIKKYAPWLSHWVSEPDRGQSHAINKGLAQARGDLLGWLNSDDYFLPGALHVLADLAAHNPTAAAWVAGCHDVDRDGRTLRFHTPRGLSQQGFVDWWYDGYFCQPASLFSRSHFEKTGGLSEELYFLLDVEFWIRLAGTGPFVATATPVAASRLYDQAKTFQDLAAREVEHIAVAFASGERKIAKKRLLRFTAEQATASRLALRPPAILHLLADRLYRDLKNFFGLKRKPPPGQF